MRAGEERPIVKTPTGFFIFAHVHVGLLPRGVTYKVQAKTASDNTHNTHVGLLPRGVTYKVQAKTASDNTHNTQTHTKGVFVMPKHYYMSEVTGEVQESFISVLMCLIERDYTGRFFFNLRWRRRRSVS